MRSLRSRLALLWVLSLAASLAVGVMLVSLYRASAAAEGARAEALAARACDLIADRWSFYASGWAGPVPAASDEAFRRDLADMLAIALPETPGLSAGIWREGEGVLAVRGAAAGMLDGAVAEAAESATEDRPALRRVDAAGGGFGLAACALPGPVAGLVAYAAIPLLGPPDSGVLQAGLGVLLGLMLAMSVLLTWLLLAWSRHLRGIEAALASHSRPEDGGGDLPQLPPTGERELDRIVTALNTAGRRLAEARQRQEALAARVAQAERLAALGRVAAGVAHEIRNPIAAMRLRAENALAGDAARREAALAAILEQIARLERLTGELLTMTQRRAPAPEDVDLAAFLHACATDHPGVAVEVSAGARARLDPALTRRALDSLLVNARQHAPPGTAVALRGAADAAGTRIEVRDEGPGVPVSLRETLFEPFVTGRADGTGLGLSIARELAEAQGGRLVLADPGGAGRGAAFVLELPKGDAWPAS